MGSGDLVQNSLAATGNDDLIAQGVKGFSQRAANTAAAAGDQDGMSVMRMVWAPVDE